LTYLSNAIIIKNKVRVVTPQIITPCVPQSISFNLKILFLSGKR